MKRSIYRTFRRNIIFFTLIVSFAPLILLGLIIYYNFAKVYEEKIEDQIKYRARTQCDAVEIFLKERLAILATIIDTSSFEYLKKQENLSHVFDVISKRTEGLVDMGIIDGSGQHLAYSGPYDLAGLNYYHTEWFHEVMRKGKYISDVFMGYRKSPHFIIAVRGNSDGQNYILRTTIDPDIFYQLIRIAQTGRTGDAFIVNKDGIYQTGSRFSGNILERWNYSTKDFGEQDLVVEKTEIKGSTVYLAGAWLKNNDWLLVISQELHEEMSGMLSTRNFTIIIISLGSLAIVVTTVLTTRMTVRRLEVANEGIDRLNTQLMQSEKLASLGKMAAGIAHEINNPLAVIGEKAGWMKDLLLDEEFKGSENYKEYLNAIEKIEHHVERARKITHNMLGFVRKMEPRLDDVDINGVLNQTIELLQSQARLSSIIFKKDFKEDIPIIASDQSQLQQIFLNLIGNSIDAIESTQKKDGLIEIRTYQEENLLCIDIEDNGSGISKEYERKIFDPFFTTKKTGKGAGLGLSICYNIVEKMGGMIYFKNKFPNGAVFTIKFPIVLPEKK